MGRLKLKGVSRFHDFDISKGYNKIKLKERLLEQFPEAQEQFDGRNTIITFNKAVQKMLREALQKGTFSEDATILAKAATIIIDQPFQVQWFLSI